MRRKIRQIIVWMLFVLMLMTALPLDTFATDNSALSALSGDSDAGAPPSSGEDAQAAPSQDGSGGPDLLGGSSAGDSAGNIDISSLSNPDTQVITSQDELESSGLLDNASDGTKTFLNSLWDDPSEDVPSGDIAPAMTG